MRKRLASDGSASEVAPAERITRLPISPAFSIRSLELFVAVVRAGSMSAAAEVLGLSQPAISQAIGALEAGLGVQLFDRSVRPPSPTLQATALLPHAAAILESVQRFDSALRLGHLAQLPTLRIGMPNSVATTIGPTIINSLRERAAQVSVDSGFMATRFQSLERREFDFILTADEATPPPEVQTTLVLTEPIMVVAPASYGGDLTDIERLSETLDLVRFGRDPKMVSRVDVALQSRGFLPPRRYHLDTNEGVLQMVTHGAGWAMLPVLALIRAIERRDPIRVAPYADASLTRAIFVAMRKGDGSPVAEHIRGIAIAALREKIRPKVQQFIPEVAGAFQIHDSGAGDVPESN